MEFLQQFQKNRKNEVETGCLRSIQSLSKHHQNLLQNTPNLDTGQLEGTEIPTLENINNTITLD